MDKISYIVDKIEKTLNNGKKIIIYNLDDEMVLKMICDGIGCNSSTVVWTTYKMNYSEDCTEHIDSGNMRMIIDLHNLYDYSGKVMIISDSKQYGNLFNYVKNGILSKEEMVEALLYKI